MYSSLYTIQSRKGIKELENYTRIIEIYHTYLDIINAKLIPLQFAMQSAEDAIGG